MAIDSRVKALYDALKADGADVGTEEEFNAYMFKPGKEGYQNRYAVYKAFKDDGADIGASYEEFGKWLGLQAVAPKPAAKPAATPAPKQTAAPKPTEYFKLRRGGVDFTVPTAEVNAAGGLGGWAKAHPGAPIRVYMSGKKADGTAFDGHVDLSEAHNRRKNSGYKYTTVSAPIQRAAKPAAPAKPQQPWKPSAIQQMALSQQLAQSQANLQSVIDQGKQQRENLAKGYKLGAGLGEREFNPTTGKMETVYYTKQGDRVHSKMEQAYHNSAADMSVGAQLRRANERLASYEAKMEERAKTLQKEHEDNQPGGFLGFLRGMGEAMAGDEMGGNLGQTPEDYIEFQTDKEYQAYRLAARKAREEIQQLENKRDQEANGKGFWRGFGRGIWQAIANVDAWDFGKNAFRDASTVMQIANDAKTKNLTPAQEEAMYELYLSNAVQEQFGDLGRGYRWGDIAGSSLSFMKDFLLTGGFSGLSTKLPEKAAVAMAKKGAQRMATNAATNFGEQVAKEGLFNFVRAGGKGAVTRLLAEQGLTGTAKILTIKALGVGAEDLLIRAPLMTGTIQGQSTAAKIINGKYGPVRVDENTGELSFAEEKGWGEAAWQEGADHVIENFSEMWGAHLPGMADVSRVFGARNLTAAILRTTREGAGTMLSKTSNFLRNAGVNGYLGEVGEEYYGQLWRTGLFLDSAKDKNGRNNFFNPDFHGDIWGGMALSIGMTGGGAMAVNYGARGGAAAYYMYLRHNVNKADAKASQVFGADEWNLMKALIDSADNGAVANLADQTMRDQEMPDEQREALMDYMEKSMILRGHNLGEMVKSRAEEADENEEALNESYINGYEGITPQEMVDAQNMFNKQRERIEGVLEADEIAELESNPIMALREMSNNDLYSQEQRDAALDYINAKIVLNGMQQRISDDIDVQIAQSDAAIMSRVNKVTGMIQPAVLNGVDDKHVFIVRGYVAINDDGTIDRSDSDKTIIVKDAQTGTVEFANPKDIVSLGEALDPEEQRAAAVDAIRMEAEQRATEAMSGKLPMNPGDVITIKDSTGTHPVTIVGTTADEEGNPTGEIIVAFEDGSQYDIAPDTLQQLADEANRERVDKFDEERIAEREAQREAAQHPQFALNDVFTVTGPDGETINGQISGEVNEDGMVEVQTDQPINGNVVNLFTPEELMNLAETYNGEPLKQEEAPAETPTDAAETNAGEDETAAQTALSQIPLDDNGQPMLTETTPDLAWDGIVESAHGDEEIAAETAKDYLDEAEADLKAAEKALKQAQEAKPTKRKPGDPAPTLDERIAAKEAAKQALEQAQGAFDNAQRVRDHWAKVVETKQRREAAIRAQQEEEARQRAAERAEAEKAEREAREEAARLEREALEGIPEWHLDTPENARKRRARRFSGQMFTRQEPIDDNHPGLGREVNPLFKSGDKPISANGRIFIGDVYDFQPSHVDGQLNPRHFVPEVQPKRRHEDGGVSVMTAKSNAKNFRPELALRFEDAFNGVPVVNSRKEVGQGNGRAQMYRYLYEMYPEKGEDFKQKLIDMADELGVSPQYIASIEHPMPSMMLSDLTDEDFIRLGNIDDKEMTSGGVERIKPKNVAQKLGDDMRIFAKQMLQSTDEEASFGQLVDRNGVDVLKWMVQKGAITNTQYQSAFDSKGNLTAEAKNDLQKVLYQAVFKGGPQQLEEMFDRLPAKAQRAILSTAFRDMDSPFAGKMLPEIQSSIIAYNMLMEDPAFSSAKNLEAVLRAVEGFKHQFMLDDRFEQVVPADNFSNFALHLAAMYKANDMSQSTIASCFNRMYDLAQGKKAATLFEEADTTEYPLADVIKKVLNIDYKPAKNGNNNVANGGASLGRGDKHGEERQRGDGELPAGGEQNPAGTEPSERGGGTARDGGRSGLAETNRRNQGAQEQKDEEIVGRTLSTEEAQHFIAFMEGNADVAPEIALTPENWAAQFGEDGILNTPIGEVKQGDNQYLKLAQQGRNGKLGMIKPTLEHPHIIIEDERASDNNSERDTSYVFIRTFVKKDGSRYYHFASITVSKDGKEVVISSQERSVNRISKLLQQGKVTWIDEKFSLHPTAQIEVSVPLNDSNKPTTTDSQPALLGINSSELDKSSDRKVNNSAPEKQVSGSESSVQPSDNKGEQTVQAAVETASAQVDTEPTPAQAEAGNYKKGHVTIGEFDITIENPAGSVRKGVDADGKEWSNTMANTYGYIKGTEGVDGDHIDVFLHSDMDQWNGRKVFVVDQTNTDGSFDEHKVMLGFNDKGEAFAAYLANYEKGWEKGRRLDCTEVNMEDFEKWIASSHRKTKPFTEYKSVKSAESAHSAIYQQNYDKFFNSYLQAIENNQIPDVKAIKAELAKIKKSIKTIEDGMAVNVNSDEDRIKAETRLEQLYGLRDAYAAALADIEKRMNGTEDSNFTLEDIEALREYNYNFAKRDESHKGLTASAIKEKIKSLEKDVEELLSIGYFATKSEAYGKQGIIRYLKELLADTEAKDEAQGYTVDEYTDRKKRKYFRVKFPRADKNVWKQRLNLAEKMGGAKVPLGYGFATKEEAEAFADKVMNDPKALADAQPLSLDDVKTATGMQEVNLEGVIKDLQEHGETNLADHSTRVEATPTEQKPTESEPEKKPVNPSGNKLVTDEQYEALLKRLKDKMGGQLNMGVDPEILAIGVQLAVYHIEKGARKFAAYVKALSADLERMGILDQFPKRYLKGFYKNAHEMLEEDAPELASEMDSDEEVNRSDVATIISGHTDPLATAEVIAGEQEAEEERKKAEEELKRQREEREASDKWIYDIKRGAGGELTLTRMTDSPVPIEDGRFRITARNVAELEGIIKNPANGLEYVLRGKTEIYKDVSVLLGMLRHEETHKGDQAKTDGTLDLAEPETKDAKELEGDSAQFQKAEQQRNALVSEIALNIEMRVQSLAKDSETKPLTMTEVKKLAKGYIELKGIADTDLQELVELAMTQLTRKVARDAMFKSAEEQRIAYDTIVKYYRMQPSLNARDSERLMKQQYSTPTPFGFVMGQFLHAGGNMVMSMLEPSAGNGALTIAVSPSAVHANDIDEARLANLRKLKFGKVTAQDALLPFGFGIYDAISTNPPFGTVAERVYDGVFKISSLEGQMAINALDAMKDNGRAAIVIGGNTSYRKNGSMNPKDAAFFGYLYSHYNVADVINISGKALYSRNGTGYDVRIILIDGRKEGAFKRTFPPVQADARAEQITTFEELYNRVQDDILRIQEQNNGTAATDVQSEAQPTADGGSRAAIRNGSHSTDGGQRGQSGTGSPVRGGSPRVGTQQPVGGHDTAGADGLGDGHRGDAGNTHAVQGGNSGQNSGGLSTGSVGDGGRRSRGTEPQQPSAQSDNNRERLAIKPDLGTEKVDYPAQSGNGFTLLSVVPAAQADVLRKSLGEIGDVDQFLVDELGYSSKEELYGYLAAEQIDSVALAINQMNQGNAFIIGDMTGVGKGRQGAALIRYAVKHGKKPIYFTQKPTLFTDNYRDLADIGSGNLRPFIIASNPKDANIVDADGKVIHRVPSKKEQERVYKYIMEHGTLPDEYDYALCTYSQVQNGMSDYEQREDGTWQAKPKTSKGGKAAAADTAGQIRRDVLSTLAQGNYVYLDESHTVGGDSGCGRYMQMLTSATEGVTFLSATFAKRADNMPIYAQRTDLSRAAITPREMIEAIAKGGVTLQEIMSRQLVESGQMIRRERSFEGVNIDWLPVPEETDRKQRAQFNEVAEIFNAIRNFQDDYITPLIEAMSGEAAGSGGYVDHTKGTKDMGVQNTPFASKMYNLVNQLLFALKVDAVADRVVENLRNGFKPVISFTNTMEGFLEEAPIGVEMDEMPNFSLTLQRALDGVMRFTETDADNNKTSDSISFGELSQAGKQAYNSIRERIAALSADLPISPMDAIRMKIEEAGYSVREITGRKLQLTKTEEGKYVVKSREDRDKKAAMRDFNNGQLDVLMINKSGSTGISLHASSKFADQRQRVMVFAQFQSDINDEVQMRGRIDRSGQVVRGRYEYIMSSIPAEQRLQMMFKAKLKSLDANTTSSQKSKFNEMEVVDYLNKYGDEVVWEYMKEHPELSERLGDPLDMLSDDKENGPRTRDKENKEKKNDCAAKLSRYLAFLSVEEQDEIFKEITDAYRVKIQLLDDAGENDLEITTMPLRAKTKSRKMWHEGSEPGSRNSFADNTYVEEVEVDVLKKPMKRAEILEQQRKLLGEEFVDEDGTINWDRYKRKKGDEITAYYVAKADETIAKLTEQGEARIAKAKEKAVNDAIALRAKGKNDLTDEQIRQVGEEVANEQREKEETKRQNRRAEILGPQARIRGLMNRFRAGTIYAIPNDLANATPGLFTPTFGTFVGFKFNKTYTIGSSTAIFATLDGRRKVEVSLRDKALDTIYESTNNAYRYARNEINAISMDNWDSHVPTLTRQTRHIITGNLLQALVDVAKGERMGGNLISYTTMDGEVRQGILMGENFKESDLRNSVPISARLAQIRNGVKVASEDGDVEIEKIMYGYQHRGDYTLTVPKSKQRGGKYTMNKDLLSLVYGHNFTTSGNKMVGYVEERNLARVLDLLSRQPLGVTVLEESKLQDTPKESNEDGDNILYRLREQEPPRKTGIGYKVFVLKNGELFPPMVANPNGEATPVLVWLDADAAPIAGTSKTGRMQVKAGGKGTQGGSGKLAYRPGWHLGEIPYALQFNRVNENGEKELFPANFVWAEVEYADDVDYQSEAMSYGYNKNGKFQHSYAGLPRVPENGSYKYRTNPNPKTDPWIITGAMRVRRLLTPTEVDEMVRAAGREPQKRQTGAVTDAQIEELNAQFAERRREGDGYGTYSDDELALANDPWYKASGIKRFSKKQRAIFAARERQRMVERIQELAERMHLDNVEVVTDVSQLEGKRAKAKGFYNKRTGKITIVIPNNVSTIDAEQTLLHEAVAHYGLRQLFGGQFDTFLDNVYQSADESIRHKIADMAAKNGWDFRTATEEYLAGLAEDTDFARAKEHAGWWTTIKRLFLDMLEKIGFEGFRDKVGVVLTDNELRYILWRSYHNLAEPGGWKSILGEAEDVAKQAELEVGNYAEKGIDAERVAEVREAEAQSAYHEMIDAVFSGNADRETYGMRYYHVANTPLFMTAVGLRGAEFTIPFKAIATHWGKDGDHRMTPDEWHRLPTALQRPFLITKYEGKADRFRIYTSLKLGGKHVVVGVDVKRVNQGRNKPMLEINSIKTVFAQSGRMAESEEIVCYDKEITPEQEALLGGRNFRQYPTVQELEAKVRENSEDTKDSDENMLFRPGDFSPRDQVLARDYYNRVVATGSYQFKEAVQDSMLGLKKLYQAILGRGTRIEDVPGFENAYLFENRMSSMNAGEQHEYFIRYMKPLLKTIGEICGSNDRKRRELTDYLMAKHGLERNAYMRQEAAANNEDTDRDFAGLMGLTGEPDWQSAEATAQDWVDNYEGEHDTNELWNNINAATKATLEKVYLSGIISKETYEKTRDMYDYYIPLRGWNQTTSDEVYGYLMSKDGPLGGSIMKSAHGRSSMADDPIATIAMMADDAIRQGNRNCMKQRFLNFILNHPSDAVSVHDIWLKYDDTTDEWCPVFADVEDTDTAEEIAQKVEAFEANMEQLSQQHPDRYKKGREAANIPYKVVKGNLKEHQILIKRNGRTFVATINGNPRAAQAVNGLTNPDVETVGVVGNMLKLGQYVNRQLSAFYTTRNPDFVISNFFRDMLYSNCMTWVKESPRYALRFHKNFGRVNPAMMRRLLAKWEKGKLNQGNRLEKLFYQFMKNGGETGYTNVRDIENHKKAIAAELKKQGRSIGLRAWTALGMQLDLLNRSAENCARFAAFVTSRDFGRSIDRAIYDAKEVSVNFNKKGSGGKMVNAVGQTKLGKFGSYLSGGGRLLYVFWNAGVQGLTNVGRAAKLHPGKFTAGASALFALGYVIPLLAQILGGGDGDDDDKNAYYNLPEYVRRSNICFYAGDQWVTIPLPIEYRAIYGLGELAHGVISGNERYTNRELAYQLTSQVSQIMPIDMLEGGGGINPFIPSAFKPYAEAYIMNKGWTGLPVYKDTPFNKNAPEWSKAYASADRHIVAFTKWLNETTGGDDFKKGAININPAKIEYLLNGTFGGLFTFPNKVNKTGETMFGDRDFEWRNIPLANRLVKSGDERTANRKLQNEYFKYKDEYERTGTLMRQYENAEEGGALEYAEKVAFLEGSPEYARWQVFDDFKTDLDDYRQEIAEETDKSVRVQLEAEYYAMMRQLVDALHNPEAYLKAATQSQQPNR